MTKRFYNPFALIRALQADLVSTKETAQLYAKQRNAAYRSNDAASEALQIAANHNASLLRRLERTGVRLSQHAQAVDAFMDEREALQLTIALSTFQHSEAEAQFETAFDLIQGQRNTIEALAQVVESAIEHTETLEENARAQAQETLDIVAWVKAAEAELLGYGITVIDGDAGPVVNFVSVDVPELTHFG